MTELSVTHITERMLHIASLGVKPPMVGWYWVSELQSGVWAVKEFEFNDKESFDLALDKIEEQCIMSKRNEVEQIEHDIAVLQSRLEELKKEAQ